MSESDGKDYISQVTVTGLFDRFDHEVKFSKDHKITILTAPNGFGKTVILKIIHSFFNKNFNFFLEHFI